MIDKVLECLNLSGWILSHEKWVGEFNEVIGVKSKKRESDKPLTNP